MADKMPWGLNVHGVLPGSATTISENKLKAFEIGSMNIGKKKTLSKKEQEDLKKKEDEAAAAQVYEEFVESFEDSKGSLQKTWVKGEVVNAAKVTKVEKNRIYKPTSKLSQTFTSKKEPKLVDDVYKTNFKKKKADEKKKSNLELFKEELKQMQIERQERHRLKRSLNNDNINEPDSPENKMPRFEEEQSDSPVRMSVSDMDFMGLGPLETNDESTTNLYVGNINPKMSEPQLCEIFGRYGPLASVKIMWPRTDEERSRARNCGFVAYMNRKDGDRALSGLNGSDIMGYEMKLGWGKAVQIPPHPVYIPPKLAELTQPPPASGLPFNAQPPKLGDRDKFPPLNYDMMDGSKIPDDLQKTLANAVVKVVIPADRSLLAVIHRMVEFVVREGPMFEAMIMNRELSNPVFRFLFDNQTPAHTYYRWKMFSILQGDTPYRWNTKEFRMFDGGSMWRPPPMNPYTQGMPDDLVVSERKPPPRVKEEPVEIQKGQLTDSQRDRLEDMLRELTPERCKVGDAMVWCLDHAESAEEIVECLSESLSILQTPMPKKIARIFLVSDILFNSSAKVPNASFFRKFFQSKLVDIFKDIRETYESIEGRLKAEQFKQKIMLCFRAWEDWTIYPNDFLIKLQNIFLGLVPKGDVDIIKDDLDGAPLEHEVSISEIDGKPLVEDYDGEPLKDDIDGEPLEKPKSKPMAAFIPSKWETVDEADLEAQAMTTSKWDQLDPTDERNKTEELEQELDGQPLVDENSRSQVSDVSDSEDDIPPPRSSQGRQEMSEGRRAKLREIELKVMKYQDELEAGRRSRKPNLSMLDQIQQYRNKLLNKESTDSPNRSPRRRRRSRSRSGSPKRAKRTKSPRRSRHSLSRSPQRKTSRSPSRHRHKHKKNRR
ncbi:hypothetical protein SNE40_001419 [Patella caerulea]|uniref:U2 snRNP-associated SURP motif-containing protein n=1 Tax=Patella caerulea TaxID=87958 RepID=A0AAN8QB49_PATCE